MKIRAQPGAYAVLEGHLGHTFRDPALLETALTHKSYVNENAGAPPHNERLEFLGDAVLGLAVASMLMAACPDRSEGELSSIRSRIVNELSLAALATEIDLGQWLYLGRGEEITGGRYKTSLLADAYEAVLGAIYQDTGFDYVMLILARLLGPQVRQMTDSGTQDGKSLLQEWMQGQLRTRPRYEIMAQEGPDHDKTFEVAVWLDNRELSRARGKSKREAEQRAAEQALIVLRTEAEARRVSTNQAQG